MQGTEQKNKGTRIIDYLIDTSRPYDIENIPLKLFFFMALLAVILLQQDILQSSGIAGAFAVLWGIGFFFFAIGERVKILKAAIGGGLIVAYAGAALMASADLVSQDQVAFLQAQIIDNRLMYFILSALVISSILSVPAKTLRKALISFAPIILGGLALAAGSGILVGFLIGVPIDQVVTLYFLPIMGGGTGAGAIPMSEIYAQVTGKSSTDYFNFAIGVLTLGNIAAILTASLLTLAANKFSSLTGNGKLVRGGEDLDFSNTEQKQPVNTHAAVVFTVCILVSGVVLAELVGLIHMFAWVTLLAISLNFTRLVSAPLQQGMNVLSGWCMKTFIVTLLVAFGLSADLEVISSLLSPGNLLLIVAIVVGAAVGAGLVAHFVNCYPFEAALSGGLCMANAGGSGDLQVLGAARRLELFPYAQVSSRLGGAFMLILGNYLFEIFY